MRALLLAAGLGTRLRPLTNFLPKCLVPIHGRPLLDYWLELLLSNGVKEILINTHYMAPMVIEFLNKSSWTDHVKIVYEESLLGTGGTIYKNRLFFKNEAFIVAHADNLTIFDVQDFIESHRDRPSITEMTMMVFETEDPQSCGIVDIDKRGVVNAFHEKVSSPPGNLANAAVYIFESSMIDCLGKIGKSEIDLSTEVIPHMMGHIFTHRNSSYHRDIGTINSWIEANRDFPVMPATRQNAKAWSIVCKSDDGELLKTVEKLLLDVKDSAADGTGCDYT